MLKWEMSITHYTIAAFVIGSYLPGLVTIRLQSYKVSFLCCKVLYCQENCSLFEPVAPVLCKFRLSQVRTELLAFAKYTSYLLGVAVTKLTDKSNVSLRL